jgi:hypothetical protein
MWSFYLQICMHAIENDVVYRTYHLIYSHPWSFYMQIPYMRDIFYGPYLSHITRFVRIDFALTSLIIKFTALKSITFCFNFMLNST